MKFTFKEIKPDFYKAKLVDIKHESSSYGPYLRFIFSIIDGDLKTFKFSAIIKPTPLKHGKFYQWLTNILGKEPASEFSLDDMIGKECLVYLSNNKNKNYFTVTDVLMSPKP